MHAQHTKLYLSASLKLRGGKKKKRKKTQQAISKTLSGFRSARFGARLENVKVVFSLYRFVRGHRTDYGGSKATFSLTTSENYDEEEFKKAKRMQSRLAFRMFALSCKSQAF